MIEPASPETALYVARRLDRYSAIVRARPLEAQTRCYLAAQDSPFSWAVRANGEPVALFGGEMVNGITWAWMFFTPSVGLARMEAVKGIRKAVEFVRGLGAREVRVMFEHRTPKQKKFLEIVGFQVRRAFRLGGRTFEELEYVGRQ